jgi:hypothetical protein
MTERDLTAGMLSGIQTGNTRPALFYEGEFLASGSPDAQFLRLWTGVGSIVWDSKTWTGGGQLLKISPIAESGRIQAQGFEVTVSGMPSDKISLALQSVQKNRAGRLWLGLINSAGAVVADPYLLKRGRFEMIPIEDDGTNATITARYTDRLETLQQPRERRYTHEDQQLRAAGDLGFQYVEQLQDSQFILPG